MSTYTATITLQELVTGGKGRSVVLSGAALPSRPTAWGGANDLGTTRYPGNRASTQQVMGPYDKESHWKGEWHSNMLAGSGAHFVDTNGTPTRLTTPRLLRDALEELFRTAQLLRVITAVRRGNDAADGSAASDAEDDNTDTIVREGRAKEWEFSVETMQRIGWSVTFEWVSRGEQKRPLTTRNTGVEPAKKSVQDLIADVLKQAEAAGIYAPRKPRTLQKPRFNLAELDRLTQYPVALTRQVTRDLSRVASTFTDLGELSTRAARVPAAVANTALDAATNSVAIGNQFVQSMGRVPMELRTVRTNRASDVARAARQFGRVQDAAAFVVRQALALEALLRALGAQAVRRSVDASSRAALGRQEGDILAVHICRVGDTPGVLSMRYYQTADAGVDILKANRMPWDTPVFKTGVVLIIPRAGLLTSTGGG